MPAKFRESPSVPRGIVYSSIETNKVRSNTAGFGDDSKVVREKQTFLDNGFRFVINVLLLLYPL